MLAPNGAGRELDVEQELLPYKAHFYWKVNA